MTYAIGVDFGTTNSVIAFADEKGGVRTVSWPSATGLTQTFRTALMFWRQGRGLGHVAGPEALERAIAAEPTERFIQSFKTHLASRVFTEARLFGQRVTIEDMTSIFLRHLFEAQGGTEVANGAFVAAGRPVVFAGDKPDEALATKRLADSYAAAGLPQAEFAFEPLGAAYWRARNLRRDETVLVADFGGGTSDFALLHFMIGPDGMEAEALGHGGCGVAGDSFDFRLIDHVISPRLGKGATYRSLDKILPLPAYYHASFAQWHQISWLKTPKTLEELRRFAEVSERGAELEALIELIELDLGFELYQTVGAVKAALSSAPEARLTFVRSGVSIDSLVSRVDFEQWIAPDLARIEAALEETLASAKIPADRIDAVFMTGGTSFIPSLRAIFERRFGAQKLHYDNPFQSVAAGLALLAADRRRRAENQNLKRNAASH
ncbi:Hsp70 family protein [Rhodoblastus sp.]|uniref:Hsp70 family protein n=1 Tax=Rhodoblastus sp. TaxID=1962975 RepID=UPI0026020D35|nr:Hsp70 family protein [Rhodoblastus sp.]